MTFIKKLNSLKFAAATGLTTVLMASDAFAGVTGGQDLADVTDSLSANIASVPTLFSSVAYILGTGFTIAGLFKLKEHVDAQVTVT